MILNGCEKLVEVCKNYSKVVLSNVEERGGYIDVKVMKSERTNENLGEICMKDIIEIIKK